MTKILKVVVDKKGNYLKDKNPDNKVMITKFWKFLGTKPYNKIELDEMSEFQLDKLSLELFDRCKGVDDIDVINYGEVSLMIMTKGKERL